jgi:NADPH-dependent curcumin reductase
MISRTNCQIRLKSRPNGIPQAEHFEIATADLPEIADRQFLVRNDYLSVEPAMRGWVAAVANYAKPVGIGEVMRAFAAGTVVASRHPDYCEGDTDIVEGIENCPGAIAELYRGENLGKRLIHLRHA